MKQDRKEMDVIVFSQRYGNVKIESGPPSSSFNFWRCYKVEVEKWLELIQIKF